MAARYNHDVPQSPSPSPETAARLLITRASERDVRSRQIFVSLDGTKLGDILFGEKIDRSISPGPHFLRVHNTLFWKTVRFEAAAGETVHFETVNYARRGFLSLVLIIGVAPLFLAVERVPTAA